MRLRQFIANIISEHLSESDTPKSNLNDKFWVWFGNSKVVDSSGNPLIVYHGTNINFNSFDIDKMRSGWLSKGFYFTADEREASDHGSNVIAAYLRLKNPFVIKADTVNDDNTVNWAKSTKEQLFDMYPELKGVDFKNVTDFLIRKGYDGMINSNNLITVFNPNQIKSTENDGSWDSSDNNIYS